MTPRREIGAGTCQRGNTLVIGSSDSPLLRVFVYFMEPRCPAVRAGHFPRRLPRTA